MYSISQLKIFNELLEYTFCGKTIMNLEIHT